MTKDPKEVNFSTEHRDTMFLISDANDTVSFVESMADNFGPGGRQEFIKLVIEKLKVAAEK